MVAPTAHLPESKSFGIDERSVLLGYLTYHRCVLARKLDGITDADARATVIPTTRMTLIGIVRHMTDVERWWFRRVFRASDVPALFDDDEEWNVPADATIADALAAFWDEIAVVDDDLATADPSDEVTPPGADTSSLRRLIVHMIEEYARHCGHADLLREAIDGVTGD